MVPKLLLVALGAAAWTAGQSPKVWTASLAPKDNSGVSGTARIETIHDDSVTATINLTGVTKNTSLGWGIHSGKCSAPGAMLGDAAAYQAVSVDSTGGGSATSTLKLDLQGDKEYSVVAHGSAAGSVAACGDLKPGSDIP